ncbi:MAG TPA: MFS transporter [Bacteroidales bacterium]|jgi:FSR family fosmidomycin resistance protein-like MFS transporter|nr:MFS transporter [Bacteroidales bacterium]MDD4235647.1 MFS transporter [Bacteroidales bacterium]HXK81452.1 MFS transporter [Bacteroidales bacterium]
MGKKVKTSKILSISLGHFFHDIYTSILAPMLPLLIDKLGITMAMAGIMDVVRKSPTLLNPLFGLIADKICIKYIIILTPAITAICMSLLGLMPSYLFVLLLLFVAGISSALFHIPSPVLIKKYAQHRTGSGMSFYMLGGEFSRSVGPVIITAAISWWGLEGSWRIMPLGIIASLFLYFKLNDIKKETKPDAKSLDEKALIFLKRYIYLLAGIGGFILFQAGIKLSLSLYLPVYLVKHGYSLWFAGISLSVLQLAGATGVVIAGFLSDIIGRKKTLIITSLLCPILMFLFINSTAVWQILLLILLGICIFAPGPVILAMVQDTNTTRPSLLNSIYMTISFGVSSLMALLIGIVADNFTIDISFKLCAYLSLLAIPVALMLPLNYKQK